MINLIKKIFGSDNKRELSRINKMVDSINNLENEIHDKTDIELKDEISAIRLQIQNPKELDEHLSRVLAIARETSNRKLGLRPFDVQLLGAIALHEGKISEMKTGEGKTLVASLAVTLNSLYQSVHLITVNDYLARRDALWMSPIYISLGLKVGILNSDASYLVNESDSGEYLLIESNRKDVYLADVVYGTNSEFGFDYLRDNMKYSLDEVSQSSHFFAIVDEVDSILIDEARTPLIISGPTDSSVIDYSQMTNVARSLTLDDVTKDEKTKQVFILESGIEKIEKTLSLSNLYDPSNLITLHSITQALRAIHMYERDKDYIVQDEKIVIIDEFTGRLMPTRRWGEGLHQAVEAKERLKVEEENQTLASITIQNYFRMYEKLSGMTGTADTESREFDNIYNLKVLVIPTNAPMVREDLNDLIYRTESEKFNAVIETILEFNTNKNPILVGTISVEKSEELSKELKKKGVEHKVLNAKNHEYESEIIADAGRIGAVTIATNMAGRGTDIKLGGSSDSQNNQSVESKILISQIEEERKKILDLGGLIVLGTERHESRRIDNQLRGRSGRQGDPGRSQFFVSMEDDLMRLFGSERMSTMMTKFGWKEGEPIEHKIITSSLENAQKKVEGRNFEMRKYLLEYDDVQNKQREVVYGIRNKLLRDGEITEILSDISENVFLNIEKSHKDSQTLSDSDRQSVITALGLSSDLEFDSLDELKDLIESKINDKILSLGELYKPVSKYILLTTLDMSWKEHLLSMDYLRDSVGLRAYGQKNPLREYKKEGFDMFEEMIERFNYDALRSFMAVEPVTPEEITKLEKEKNKQEQVEYLSDSEIVADEEKIDFQPKEEDNKNKTKSILKNKMQKEKNKRRVLEKQKRIQRKKQRK
ncbi:MAG: preprotein translocase subunit SecA [Thermodesulfobacteriota bacteirum]|nr:preprotein translocase subunit SecA [Thermodesulfobacteriota bacterium]